MSKKLIWFYRLALGAALILITTHVLTKAITWSSALEKPNKIQSHPIFLRKHTYASCDAKYTTQLKQNAFDLADYLLRPGFILLFIVLAVRLIKAPNIFAEVE